MLICAIAFPLEIAKLNIMKSAIINKINRYKFFFFALAIVSFSMLQGCSFMPQALRREADAVNTIGKKAVLQNNGWYLYSIKGNSKDVRQYVAGDKAYFVLPARFETVPAVLPPNPPAALKQAFASFARGSVPVLCSSSHQRSSSCDKSNPDAYEDCRYLHDETVSCLKAGDGSLTVELNNFYERHKSDLNYSNMNPAVSARIFVHGSLENTGFYETVKMIPEQLLFICDSKSCYFADENKEPVNVITVQKKIVFNNQEIQSMRDEEKLKERQERIADYFEGKGS